jgi:hypothetical protein
MQNTKKQREKIAQEIERSFVSNIYPGDDKLIRNSENYEADELIQDFESKSWKEIDLKITYRHRLSLPLFTSEAFCFFLPGLLIATLRAPRSSEYNPGEILEFIFYNLIPSNDADDNEMMWLLGVIDGLNSYQKASIGKFIRFFIETNPEHAKLYKDKAYKLWNLE